MYERNAGCSFYPIFPVPLELAHEVNLDVTHSEMLNLCPQDDNTDDAEGSVDPSRARCAPEVLIVPSRLKHFSKVRLAPLSWLSFIF